MAATELARLTRRVDKQDEDLRALSDTVLEIREIVDGHTVTLVRHSEILDRHTEVLDRHSEILDRHSEILDRHTEVLDRHTDMLTEILRRLEPAG